VIIEQLAPETANPMIRKRKGRQGVTGVALAYMIIQQLKAAVIRLNRPIYVCSYIIPQCASGDDLATTRRTMLKTTGLSR
jgi:hypothetical protein